MRLKASISLSAVTERNYHSFSRWILDKKPLTRGETDFLKHREDFVALADGQEGGWFDGFLEDVLGLLPRVITKVYYSHPRPSQTSSLKTSSNIKPESFLGSGTTGEDG